MDLTRIREHWERVGRELSLTDRVTATSRDPYLGLLERANILEWLDAQADAVEVGCGDASHTVHYAHKVRSITGVDVAASLIDLARERTARSGISNASFLVSSVLDLGHIRGTEHPRADCVITQRCLINLPEWQHQREAIVQIGRLLKPGGLFLMTEGFQEEFTSLNRVRTASGLPAMVVVDYNRNLTHEEFDPFIREHFDVVQVVDYGFYLFMSRVFHPLAVLPDQPRHDSPLNRTAMQVVPFVDPPPFRQDSYNLFYVLRKR